MQRHVENVIMMFNHAGFSLLECVYLYRLLFLQCAIFMVAHIVTKLTSLNSNFSMTKLKQWRKYRQFLINISRFEDILDLKYKVLCFINIKHTIYYEFITLTHTMMIGQLHTSSIDLYVKHALL